MFSFGHRKKEKWNGLSSGAAFWSINTARPHSWSANSKKLRVNDDAYESDAGVTVADEWLDVLGLINENTEAAVSLPSYTNIHTPQGN